MVEQLKYKTKPLECWKTLKELRLKHYLEIGTAKEKGKSVVTGSTAAPYPLVAGLGDNFVFLGGEPYGASIGHDVSYSLKCMQAAEAKGFTRDMCGYMRNYWGSMFLDHFYFTDNSFPTPDFCLTEHLCDAGHSKWFQVVAEHYGVPLISLDLSTASISESPSEHKIEFIASQLNDAIEQMERITKQKYNWDAFIESSRRYFRCENLWGEICLMNSAVPAPIGLKTLLSFMPVSMLLRGKQEAIDALEMLKSEIQDRIDNQIAAIGNERVRLATDMTPPWHFVQMYKTFEDAGVDFVGIWAYTLNSGNAIFNEDGTVSPDRKTHV